MGFGQWLAFNTFSAASALVVWEVILGTCLIAFGGYVINDFYDQKIDEINRPGKNLFTRSFFKKHWILFYSLSSLLGFFAGALVGWPMFVLNFACALSLFFYASVLKKKLIIGNLLVALLQGMVFVPVVFTGVQGLESSIGAVSNWQSLTWSFGHVFCMGIIAFAFLTGWIREWVKDMEDVDGDRDFGARTAAVIWSYGANKKSIAALCALLTLGVAGFTLFIYTGDGYQATGVLGYYFLFLLLPISIRSFIMTIKAKEQEDWTKLSQWMKMIMLAGILSMGVA